MKNPTNDEAIHNLESHKRSGYELPNATCDLAIKALEEMKAKKDYCRHCEVSPTFPGKIVSHCRGEDIILTLPFPKPHTWRDVTAGEIHDEANKQLNYYVANIVLAWSKQALNMAKFSTPVKPLSDPHGF